MIKWDNAFCFIVISAVICAAGCARVSDEERKKVLDADPAFAQILEKKKGLDRRAGELRENFSRRSSGLKNRIAVLKKELANNRRAADLKIKELNRELGVERQKIGIRAEQLKGELRILQSRLKNLKQMSRSAARFIKMGGDIKLSGEEEQQWRGRMEDLNAEIEKIREEVNRLKEKLKILVLELRLLRQ